MSRSLRPRAARALKTLVLGLLVLGTVAARAQSTWPAPPAAVVKDEAWAEVLGQALFWDTVDVMTASSAASYVAAPAPESRQPGPQHTAEQVARILLAHRPLDGYLWLIQQAFDDSLWKGPDQGQLERNFPLIWSISTSLYESTLQSSPARLHVCTPNPAGDAFDCRDEAEPARMVPIPSQGPALLSQDQPAIG